jgi:hypothetical protein
MPGYHWILYTDTYGYHYGYTRYVRITVWISKKRSYTDMFPKRPKRYLEYPWISMIIQGYPRYPAISAGFKFPDGRAVTLRGSASGPSLEWLPVRLRAILCVQSDQWKHGQDHFATSLSQLYVMRTYLGSLNRCNGSHQTNREGRVRNSLQGQIRLLPLHWACSAVVIALRFGTQGPGFEPGLFHKACYMPLHDC